MKDGGRYKVEARLCFEQLQEVVRSQNTGTAEELRKEVGGLADVEVITSGQLTFSLPKTLK